ncbi:MAG: sel1 repeat family protein [Methanothrix sp.]|nr:MAG: sel1 repeat family protein [Methanothrix sp.]
MAEFEASDKGDYDSEFKRIALLATEGDPEAQVRLGELYFRGHGVSRSPADATNWFKRAAEQGNASAQHILGLAYQEGKWQEENFEEALKWELRAARQGYHVAQYYLGEMYWKGIGVEPNALMAYVWVSLAAEQGMSVAETARQVIRERLGFFAARKAKKLLKEYREGILSLKKDHTD